MTELPPPTPWNAHVHIAVDAAAPPVTRSLTEKHALPTALRFGVARTMCGLVPIDPRHGLTPEEMRALPAFADVPEKDKCAGCAEEIAEIESWED